MPEAAESTSGRSNSERSTDTDKGSGGFVDDSSDNPEAEEVDWWCWTGRRGGILTTLSSTPYVDNWKK